MYSLPPTLFETYERILDRINLSNDETKELVHRILVWTIYSVTPLSLRELLEAVSINLFDKKLDREGIPNEKSILRRCSSLVRKTKGLSGPRIELAHFSVKEFLLLRVQDDPYAIYRVSQRNQNAYMSKVCLTYLLFEDFRDIIHCATQANRTAFEKQYALYEYASLHFAHHICCNADDEDILKLLKSLFDPTKTNNFVSWAMELLPSLYDYNENDRHCKISEIIASTSTLYFATLLSLHRVVEWLTSDACLRSRSCYGIESMND